MPVPNLHISLQALDGGLRGAQAALALCIPLLSIVLPLQLVGIQLQLPLLAVAHSLLRIHSSLQLPHLQSS